MLPDTPFSQRLTYWATLTGAVVLALCVLVLIIIFVGFFGAVFLGIVAVLLALALCSWAATAIFGPERVKAALGCFGIEFDITRNPNTHSKSPLVYPRDKPRTEEAEDAVVLEWTPPKH